MGIWAELKNRARGRRPKEPTRDTFPFPGLIQYGSVNVPKRLAHKPTPRNLRYFARTPYARRAINTIKNHIGMLDWEVGGIDGVDESSELKRQIEAATECLLSPNRDDNFRSFVEAVTEDILLGAGAIEQQLSGNELRPLFMWPVDGLTIQIYPGWSGAPNEARYVQALGYGTFSGGGQQIPLRNDELIYIRPNPSSSTPFGLGPVEVAFNSITRLLGIGEFAGNVSTNAHPSIGIDLGDGVTAEILQAFKSYWRNEVEGQGNIPIFGTSTSLSGDGKTRGPDIKRLYPEGDAGLYLKFQEFLKSEIAIAFDLSPQNLGVERDVNRNTAEVAEDRDRDGAIKPMANLIASHITREALRAKLGFSQLEFRFVGIDPEDEESLAHIYAEEFKSNAILPDEYRAKRGMEPMDNQWGQMTYADMEIAIMAARGAGQVDDPALTKTGKPAPKKSKKG